ncbi:SCP-like protein [Streptococcus sp. oral taxon 071 str. 73H25AP]|uniref:CAP domain-containing protein n=1 Tax=Streptococcus sp. oral taxon 071 TaxID=712630 RepID=UPI0001E0F991|nr:CAP domain-containing protein [Streptococcus sp. oral taxon 071]EFM34738.1 SCP-like protein [Streptococcus sp. oral taxon 071 str. 73H25AP]
MKYKKVLSSFTLATALLAASAINQEVQANEKPVDAKEKAVAPSSSEKQITDAQEEVKKAQASVDEKAPKEAEAKKDVAKADKKIADTKKAIEIAKNADAIIEKESKVASEKSAEKAEADKALANAESTATAAKSAETEAKTASQSANEKRDAKAAEVKEKQAELDGMTDESLKNQISNAENEVKKADQSLQEQTKAANAVANKIADKQKELDNYKPTVLKKVLNPEEQGRKAPAFDSDYDYNKQYRPKDASGNPLMENVYFQGVREVEIEATEEMKRFTKAMADYNANPSKYKTRPVFKFVVDNRKLTEAFIELVNELRHANGVTQDLALDEAYIKHAQERSNEMATTGVLSHDTKLSHPDGEDVRVENIGMSYLIPGSDGGPNFVEVKNGQTIYNFDKIMTYKQFAYQSLLAWYADFNNIKGIDYGHRRALLTPVGGKVGVAQGTIEGKNPNYIYHTYISNAYTPETVKEYRSNFYAFNEDDKLHPTFYGKRMKFLPEHHFVYVEKTVIDKSADLKAELASLKAEKADKDAKKVATETKKADLLANLDKLNKQANNLVNAREQVKKDLEQAKSDLATLTADAKAKSELVATKSQEATKASQNLKALQAKVAELATAIKNAEEKRDKAMALKGQASALETTLKQAEEDRAKAQKVSDQAEAELKVAQAALAEAKVKLQALLDVLEAENMLKVAEKDGMIIGLPKNAPIQAPLPEFDLRKLADKPQGAEANKPGEKASTKALPNTGTNSGVDGQTTLFGVYGLLASLGLAGIATRRRRQGK